jgi:hypothetical protein
VANALKRPAIGNKLLNAAKEYCVQYSIMLIKAKTMIREAGLPAVRALPEPTNNPVPIAPPIARIC